VGRAEGWDLVYDSVVGHAAPQIVKYGRGLVIPSRRAQVSRNSGFRTIEMGKPGLTHSFWTEGLAGFVHARLRKSPTASSIAFSIFRSEVRTRPRELRPPLSSLRQRRY